MKAVDCVCGGKVYVRRGTGTRVSECEGGKPAAAMCMKCGIQQNAADDDMEESYAIFRWNVLQAKLAKAEA